MTAERSCVRNHVRKVLRERWRLAALEPYTDAPSTTGEWLLALELGADAAVRVVLDYIESEFTLIPKNLREGNPTPYACDCCHGECFSSDCIGCTCATPFSSFDTRSDRATD